MTTLPIDIVPGTNPPKFKWNQTVSLPTGGTVSQPCEGLLPPAVERAVKDLVELTKRTLMDNAGLNGQVRSLTEQIDRQATPPQPERIAETPIPEAKGRRRTNQ